MQLSVRPPKTLIALLQAGVKVLGVVLLVAFGSHAWPEPSAATDPEAELAHIQNKVRQISSQLQQLKQSTTLASKNQQDVSKAITQQVDNLAMRQTELKQAVADLEASGQQQFEQLQAAHQRLRWAFWIVLVLLCLALGGLAFRVRQRPTQQAPLSAPTPAAPPSPVDAALYTPADGATDTEPVRSLHDKADGAVQALLPIPTAAAPAPVPETETEIVTHSPESPAPSEVAPWAALVAADLQNTQLAMAQARQDFMRTPRIQP